MFAVKGRAWRAIGPDDQPADGEKLVSDLPAELLQRLPAEVVKERMTVWLDGVVKARGYDSIVSCASYATSTHDQFRAEAQAAIAWRDAVYAKGYEILANTPDGVATPDDVMALLPQPAAFGWPTP